MTRLFYCFLAVCLFSLPAELLAKGNVITGNYKVNGVCEQCKARIEAAAYVKGVKYADWNVDSHNLTLKYDSTKTSADVILKSIVKAGHDVGNYTATLEDYNKLPSCCRYRTAGKMH